MFNCPLYVYLFLRYSYLCILYYGVYFVFKIDFLSLHLQLLLKVANAILFLYHLTFKKKQISYLYLLKFVQSIPRTEKVIHERR